MVLTKELLVDTADLSVILSTDEELAELDRELRKILAENKPKRKK